MTRQRGAQRDASPLKGSMGDLVYSAIVGGDLMKAQGMIMAGADITSFRDVAGRSILHAAVNAGSAGICRMLLSNKAEVDTVDGQFRTVLHYASERGNAVIVSQLLEANAKLNVLDIDLESPVSLAASSGHLETLRSLLKASAQPDALKMTEVFGEEASLEAEMHGEAPLTPASPLLRSLQRDTAYSIVEELLKARASVNVADSHSNQPLHLACLAGSAQGVQLLLDARANLNATNKELRTPLHLAAHRGISRIVKKLLAAKAQVDAHDMDGLVPEQHAPDRLVGLQLGRASAAASLSTASSPRFSDVSSPISPPLSPSFSTVGIQLAGGSLALNASAKRQIQQLKSASQSSCSSPQSNSGPRSPGESLQRALLRSGGSSGGSGGGSVLPSRTGSAKTLKCRSSRSMPSLHASSRLVQT